LGAVEHAGKILCPVDQHLLFASRLVR
jgi:hypothetical protein